MLYLKDPRRKRGRTYRPGINEWLISSLFMLEILNSFLSEIALVWNLPYSTGYGLIFGLFLAAVSWVRCFLQNPKVPLLTILIAALCLFASCMYNPEIFGFFFDFGDGSVLQIIQSNFVILFGLCLPAFLLCFCPVDTKRLCTDLYRYSVVNTVLFVFLMALNMLGFSEWLNYMNVAYNALPGIAFLFYDAGANHRKTSTLLWMLGVLGVALGGSRGALLTLFVILFLWWVRGLRKMTLKKLVLIYAVGVFIILAILNLEELIGRIDDLLQSFGYESRLVQKYLNTSRDGNLFVFEDRAALIEKITSNLGFWGHGIYSDRLVLDGQYVHNFFLEILYQFGVFIGLFIILFVLIFIYTSYRNSRKKQDDFLLFGCVILISLLSVKLMFSASYLGDRPVWFFAGITYLAYKNQK